MELVQEEGPQRPEYLDWMQSLQKKMRRLDAEERALRRSEQRQT